MPNEAEDALTFSKKAVQFDKLGNVQAAIYYYRQAAKFLELELINNVEVDGEQYRNAAFRYLKRADVLEQLLKEKEEKPAQSESQQILQRCNFLFSQAIDADERGHRDIAVDLYGQTVEFVLQSRNTCDSEVQAKLTKRAEQALDRAEELKGIDSKKSKDEEDIPEEVSSNVTRSGGASGQRPPLHRGSSAHLKISGGATKYTDEEKRVLLTTSRINGIDYVPFMEIDLKERFQYAIPFSDRNGILKLSPKQKVDFVKWARPEELHPTPRMISPNGADYFSIKQTIISDCSFVASLAVSALYEARFKKRLITSIIYPRNKNKEPIYNPFGKYMVKFHLNGVPRKVIIDDTLPVGRYGQLLCSYSTNPGEFWISLLEKAYMKVMGGYDFPGSNSNIDLHALTGWIPERIAIRVNDSDFNSSAIFQMLEDRLRIGHCIGTVATGEMSDAQAERTGLVPTHAYAVLNVKTVHGIKLLQLKNPWSHVRWRGNYSELDVAHWTPELKEALNFDPDSASMFDNGIFWIDYESILRFFDVFYLNWNPEIFSYTYCIHQVWSAGVGPVKDVYNIGENPQFKLHIPGTKAGSVWVLLTRHITDVEDFKDNREFITLLVYKTNGNKVYYPHDPPPYIDGVRINSPHYLCKILLNESSSRTYTLVISQYEKMNNIYYTLRAYSTLPFSLNKIERVCNYVKEKINVDTLVNCERGSGVTISGPLRKRNKPNPGDIICDIFRAVRRNFNMSNCSVTGQSTPCRPPVWSSHLLPMLVGVSNCGKCFEVSDQWKGETAGGCGNHPETYPNNPRYQLVVESNHNNNTVIIDLKGPKQYQIGFDIRCVLINDNSLNFGRRSSQPYRSGFVIMELDSVAPATYNITPTTFYPGQEGPFILAVKATCPISLTKLQ